MTVLFARRKQLVASLQQITLPVFSTPTYAHLPSLQDFRTLRFAHKQETHGRRGMYERLQIVAFPTSYGKNTFAQGFKGDYPENGWNVYDAEVELKRLVRV